MKLIAAVDKNWAIGKDNQLLIHIPDDMKRFRAYTTGNTVVMGRKTLESFPGKKPLKDRENIVLTKNPNYQVKDATICQTMDELTAILEKRDSDSVYVIGGESIYKQMLSLCDTAIITKIDFAYAADAYFPNLEENPEWELVEESEEQTYFDVVYTYQTYKRK